MADDTATTQPAPASPKKGKKGAAKQRAAPAKTKKAKPAAMHPKVSEMVGEAIADLKEKGGSSLVAIKKYIAGNYKVDVERLSPFIKKYLKTAVADGSLIQTKGKGANGSFKLKSAVKTEVRDRKPARRVASSPKKAKTPVKKASPKRAAPKKKTKIVKKVKKAVVKSPKKAKKALKPKSPKPKKAKAKSPKKSGRR